MAVLYFLSHYKTPLEIKFLCSGTGHQAESTGRHKVSPWVILESQNCKSDSRIP